MNYNFDGFTKDFCKDSTKECLGLISKATSFNLVAMSGVGITFFAQYLETKSKDDFVYINTYEMPEFSKDNFYEQLYTKLGGELKTGAEPKIEEIKCLLDLKVKSSKRKLVLVINRLDRLDKILDQNFFDILRFFKDVDRSKIVMIFVSSRQIIDQYSSKIKDLFNLVSKTVFFKPFSIRDLRQVLKIDGSSSVEEGAVALCGGHHNLYNVLSRCQSLDNPLSDSMVELLIKDLCASLPRKTREELKMIIKKGVAPKDDYLTHMGYAQKVKGRYKTFSPLLSEYMTAEESRTNLPYKEAKLLNLLKTHLGKPVTKNQIFDTIWQHEDGIASEWALNSLVYRLRNHPAFDSKRYIIKSYKKVGYTLLDSLKD